MYELKVSSVLNARHVRLRYQSRISVFVKAADGWHLRRHASFNPGAAYACAAA